VSEGERERETKRKKEKGRGVPPSVTKEVRRIDESASSMSVADKRGVRSIAAPESGALVSGR